MSTEIAKADTRQIAIKKQLEVAKNLIAQVAPKHLTADRMIRIAMMAVSRQPKLLECSQVSILRSVMHASELGLEPGGAQGHGYLVPYRTNMAKRGESPRWVNECQFIAGYRGLMELARNSGEIEILEAHPVCKGDKFTVKRGSFNEIVHEPDYLSGERGDDAVCYYAIARYKSGQVQFEVMTRRQIEDIMARTQSKGEYGPWVDNFDEMARKTVIRRLCKSLPLKSDKFAKALELSDARDEGDAAIDMPIDVSAVVVEEDEVTSAVESAKVAVNAARAKKAAEAKPAATAEQIAEVGRLREKLENLNPLAAQIGKDAPNTQDAYAALIGQLQAEVNKAEGK